MLATRIAERARPAQLSGNVSGLVLSVEDVLDLAQSLDLRPREVEIQALEQGVAPERYARNVGGFGDMGLAGQLRLLKSHAAVIGLGGLGGFLVDHLARLGVGELTLVDGDFFTPDNLNRQILSDTRRLGVPKVQAAREHIQAVNPAVTVHGHQVFLDESNARELLAGVQVVLDGLDRIPSRFILERCCRELSIPLVHGAVTGWAGQVLTIFPHDPGLEWLYGHKPADAPAAESTVAPAVAIVAAVQAAEALKVLTGQGEPLRGTALFLDLARNWFETVDLAAQK